MGDVYHEIVPCGDVLLHLRQQTEDETMFKTITYRLSSSHLALASGYFKRMFSGDWKEKESLAYGKPMEINAQDWNPVALLILMNIIHGRTRVVPRKVQLPLLLDIATLVDYYKCLEAIEIVLEIWLDEPMIKSAQEKFLEPTTLTWAWAAYVFQRPILFRETTRLILLHSKNPLDPGQYPIPQLMIDKLHETRANMFGKVYDIFDKVLDNLRTRKNSCDNFDCRSWLFGALTLKLHELDFVRPEPNVTSLRLTFEETVELAGTVNTTTHHSRYYERCNLQQLINPELRRLGESIKGLALTDVQMLASIAAFSNSITRSAVNF